MNIKSEISKDTSLILKGIAVVLLVMTHLCGVNNEWIVSIPLGYTNGATILSMIGRSCFYIFAFLTGYGMYHSYKKGNIFKASLKKGISFLLLYWLILLSLFLPFYIATGSWDTKEFFLSLIGVGHINIYSWYVYFYLIVLITLPLLRLILNKHWSIVPISIVVLIGVYLILMKFQNNIPIYDNLCTCLFCYISVLIGYAFAKECYLTKIVKLFKEKRVLVIISSLLLYIASFILYFFWTKGILMPFITMFLIICLATCFTYNVPTLIKKTLTLLGSVSTALWFIHAVVLTPYINRICNFEWFFYLPREAFVVVIFTIVILLPVAWIYTKVHSFAINKLFMGSSNKA